MKKKDEEKVSARNKLNNSIVCGWIKMKEQSDEKNGLFCEKGVKNVWQSWTNDVNKPAKSNHTKVKSGRAYQSGFGTCCCWLVACDGGSSVGVGGVNQGATGVMIMNEKVQREKKAK